MTGNKLSKEQIDARYNAFNEAIDHICDNNAFETKVEREQAQVLAGQLSRLRDRFLKKYSARE